MRSDEETRRKKMQQNYLFKVFVIAGPLLVFLFMESGVIRKPSGIAASKVGKFQGLLLLDPNQAAVWKKISDKLCPAMTPQSTKYARHIFYLAQLEILQGNSSQDSQANTPTNCTVLREQKMNPNASMMEDEEEFAVQFFEHPTAYWQTFSHLEHGKRQFFSYLSVWKCANTQIRMFQKQIFDTFVPFPNRNRKQSSTKKKKKKKRPKVHDCVVSAIRDPISHFLSGYNEIEYRINVEMKDPREAIAKEWPFGTKPPGSIQRFEQFVTDLVTCPIAKKLPGIVGKYPNILELAHVYSMSAILRLLDKDPDIPSSHKNFHYLPTLANLNETWAPFVLESCPTAFTEDTKAKFSTIPMRTERWHETSKDPLGSYKAAKEVMKQEGRVAKALCALHLMDYACWQDLPDGVPKVCMDLYLDYHVRGLLL